MSSHRRNRFDVTRRECRFGGRSIYAFYTIGNRQWSSANAVTNTYTANKFQLEHRGL